MKIENERNENMQVFCEKLLTCLSYLKIKFIDFDKNFYSDMRAIKNENLKMKHCANEVFSFSFNIFRLSQDENSIKESAESIFAQIQDYIYRNKDNFNNTEEQNNLYYFVKFSHFKVQPPYNPNISKIYEKRNINFTCIQENNPFLYTSEDYRNFFHVHFIVDFYTHIKKTI